MIDWRIFCAFLFSISFWQGAGGDYLRYLDVYDTILEAPQNFEFIFHYFLIVGKLLGFDYYVVQALFIIIPAIGFVYYCRHRITFYFSSSFLYCFVVFGIGSPRQFFASIIGFFAYESFKVNRFFSIFLFALIFFVHKGVALVYFAFLFLFILLLLPLYVLPLLFIFAVFFLFNLDLFYYFYVTYISGDLISYGFIYRVIPFVILYAFLLLTAFRRSHLHLFSIFSFFILLSSLSAFNISTTVFDRMFMSFFPLFLYLSNNEIINRRRDAFYLQFLFGILWLVIICFWYFYSSSAENWRFGLLWGI